MKVIIQKGINLISGFVEEDELVNLEFFQAHDFNPEKNEAEATEIINSQGNSYLVKNMDHAKALFYKQEQLFFIRSEKTGIISKIQLPESFIISKTLEKERKKTDKQTKLNIEEGFFFDGNLFSLSQNAQLNWQRLASMRRSETAEPYEISTKSGDSYFLANNKIEDFIDAAESVIRSALKKGRQKKQKQKQ